MSHNELKRQRMRALIKAALERVEEITLVAAPTNILFIGTRPRIATDADACAQQRFEVIKRTEFPKR